MIEKPFHANKCCIELIYLPIWQQRGFVTSILTYRLFSNWLLGNLWRELWETSKPVPAVRQAPLYDEDLAV